MAANCDLIVIHGPSSPAVSSLLRQKLSNAEEYIHVYPSQLYKDHPDFGVRDIANYVLGLLRKPKRVVVEDSCAGGGVTSSLLKVIPSKLSACKIHVIELRPRHGQQQVLWDRQFILATCQHSHQVLSDEQICRWFDEQGFLKIPQTASSGACCKETVSLELTAVTNYKFEVPSLLVQWECMVDSGGYLQSQMTAACQHWVHTNHCGRVIAVCDGTAVAKGQLSAVQQKSQIISCMKALVNELPCPVYGLQVTSTMAAGELSLPPNPGLLAFLQRRHCIDLHHRSTVYVYSDSRHMKMAEQAGVRHIKIGKVLKKPEVMKTCHSATASPVPDMLRQLQLVTGGSVGATSPLPSVPLVDHLDTFADQCTCVDHPRGLREFLFAQDSQHLQRFQTQYADHATPIGETGSRMEKQEMLDKTPHHLEISLSDIQGTLKERTSFREQTSESGHRPIPKWMLRKRESSVESESVKGTLEKSSSTSSVEGRGRSRHTVYIMTEKELLETAKDVLKQAGREDLIATCIIQSTESKTAHSTRREPECENVPTASAESTLRDMEMTKVTGRTSPPSNLGQQDVLSSVNRDEDMTEVIGPSVSLRIGVEYVSTCRKKQRLSSTTDGEASDGKEDILHMVPQRKSGQSKPSTSRQQTVSPQKKDHSEEPSSKQQKLSPQKSSQSKPSGRQQRSDRQAHRKPPDLSVLDEIFF